MNADGNGETQPVRVRILLDVDGVLNAVTKYPDFDIWPDWDRAKCMGYTIRYSREMGARLGALAATPGVELVWLTTWEHEANVWIGPLFDWPQHRVIDRRDLRQERGITVATAGWWKYDEARELFENDGIPFVWIDDDLGDSHDEGAADWVRSLNGQALGIRPHGERGITPRLMGEIEAFVNEHLADPAVRLAISGVYAPGDFGGSGDAK